jgi:glutamate-1-semialdehyde aminotransferase
MPDSPTTDQAVFDREHLAGLISRERETYGQRHPESLHVFRTAGGNLLGGVPMTWMRMWAGGFPIYFAEARGARLSDIDGNTFIPAPPRTGGESEAAADPLLDEYLHLYTVNRGVLMTPFHNMALMSPTTATADADFHTRIFAAAADELLG